MKRSLLLIIVSLLLAVFLVGQVYGWNVEYVIEPNHEAIEAIPLTPSSSVIGNVSATGSIYFHVSSPSGNVVYCSNNTTFTLFSFNASEDGSVKAQGDYYDVNFEWDYGGKHWTWNLSIPKSLYEAYKSVPESTRVKNGVEGYGLLTTTNNYYLQMIAEKLNEIASQEGYNEVNFVLAFVQSLPYTSDSVTSGYDEYPRFPIETLADGGDCEDTSILFATITLIMNYGTVYINPPDHLAVGVLGYEAPIREDAGKRKSYYVYDGKTYYYCETTGNGWKIGELPDEFKDQEVHIYSINTSQQYVPSSEIVPSATPSPISCSPSVTPTPSIPFDSIFDSFSLFLALLVVAVILIVAVVSISAKKGKEPVIGKSAIPPSTLCCGSGLPNSTSFILDLFLSRTFLIGDIAPLRLEPLSPYRFT